MTLIKDQIFNISQVIRIDESKKEWLNLQKINDPNVIYGKHICDIANIANNWNSTRKFIFVSTYNGDYGIYHRNRDRYYFGATNENRELFDINKCLEKCFHIFSTNCNVVHEKITVLPYGMHSAERVCNSFCKYIDCIASFSVHNCPKYRFPAYQSVQDKPYIHKYFGRFTEDIDKKYTDVLKVSKFSICPPGNGIDTYRFYESLYCKCIPIVLDLPIYQNFKDLPILIVQSYEDINKPMLDEVYEKYQNIDWNYDKINIEYYHASIINKHKELLC